MAVKAEGVAKAGEGRRREQAQYWVYFDGEFKRYGDARLGLMTHALHYGTGVFEGLRAYWNAEHEQLFILKPREHYERMHRSGRSPSRAPKRSAFGFTTSTTPSPFTSPRLAATWT